MFLLTCAKSCRKSAMDCFRSPAPKWHALLLMQQEVRRAVALWMLVVRVLLFHTQTLDIHLLRCQSPVEFFLQYLHRTLSHACSYPHTPEQIPLLHPQEQKKQDSAFLLDHQLIQPVLLRSSLPPIYLSQFQRAAIRLLQALCFRSAPMKVHPNLVQLRQVQSMLLRSHMRK